jgi:serine/threonine protein kinase
MENLDGGEEREESGYRERITAALWEDAHAHALKPVEAYVAAFPDAEALVRTMYAAVVNALKAESDASRTVAGFDGASLGVLPDPNEGRTLGAWKLLRRLGSGGQGAVYLAEDPLTSRRAAVKLLFAAGLSVRARERFKQEAVTASRLNHAGICAVLESELAGSTPYIVMQYVEGETLAAKLASARTAPTTRSASKDDPSITSVPTEVAEKTQGSPDRPSRTLLDRSRPTERSDSVNAGAPSTPSEISQVLGLVEQIARALHVAHEAGIVHRDVKPGNLMVTAAGDPVVLDFGLASDADDDGPPLTLSGELLGTPPYMSPEQIAARRIPLDRRTDVWSLGVTLFECLTLNRPFEGASNAALYQAILTKDPRDVRRLNPALSDDIRVVLETALDKDRDRRYSTALAFAEDLRRANNRESVLARPATARTKVRRWAQRNPAVAALTLVAALLLIGGLAFALLLLQERTTSGIERELRIAETSETMRRRVKECLSTGNWQGAINLLDSARPLAGPESAEALVARLQCEFALRRTDAVPEILSTLEKSQLTEPQRNSVTLVRATAACASAGSSSTVPELLRSVDCSAALSEADRLYGRALLRDSLAERAKMLAEAVRLEAKHALANELYVSTLFWAGNYRSLCSAARVQALKFPDSSRAFFVLACGQAMTGDATGSQETLSFLTSDLNEPERRHLQDRVGYYLRLGTLPGTLALLFCTDVPLAKKRALLKDFTGPPPGPRPSSELGGLEWLESDPFLSNPTTPALKTVQEILALCIQYQALGSLGSRAMKRWDTTPRDQMPALARFILGSLYLGLDRPADAVPVFDELADDPEAASWHESTAAMQWHAHWLSCIDPNNQVDNAKFEAAKAKLKPLTRRFLASGLCTRPQTLWNAYWMSEKMDDPALRDAAAAACRNSGAQDPQVLGAIGRNAYWNGEYATAVVWLDLASNIGPHEDPRKIPAWVADYRARARRLIGFVGRPPDPISIEDYEANRSRVAESRSRPPPR